MIIVFFIFFSCLAIYSIYNIKVNLKKEWKNDKCLVYSQILCTCFIIYILNTFATSYFPLFWDSNMAFDRSELFKTTTDMIHCIEENMPELSLQYEQIRKCLKHVRVYKVRNGRLPYIRGHFNKSDIMAFVIKIDNDSVFVTKQFLELSNTDRALIMIHECAHIGIGAKDYAYLWQEEYSDLTKSQHLMNADSFMHNVLDNCT